MKNMDKFWQGAELIFQKQLDNKKTVIGGYAISFICVAISILLVSIMLWRHNEFSAETIETAVASLIFGIIGFVFCFFRKSASIRVKFYTACLALALFSVYVLIFHPEATSRHFPYPEFNRAVDFAGIVFFGGGGLWVLYNDCKWHLRHKNNKHSNYD